MFLHYNDCLLWLTGHRGEKKGSGGKVAGNSREGRVGFVIKPQQGRMNEWEIKGGALTVCIQSLQSQALLLACWLASMNGSMDSSLSSVYQSPVITAYLGLKLEMNGEAFSSSFGVRLTSRAPQRKGEKGWVLSNTTGREDCVYLEREKLCTGSV